MYWHASRADRSTVSVARLALGDQQRDITAPDVDRPVEDALGAVAGDRHADLLADVAIARLERRSLGDDRLVEHQQDGACTPPKTAL